MNDTGMNTAMKTSVEVTMAEEMPFLLEIPEDRIIGGSHGDLYCFVPRDAAQKLTVEHVTWVKQQFDIADKHDAVLYETTDAEPFLVYVRFEYLLKESV